MSNTSKSLAWRKPQWGPSFLLALREKGNILRACETAGVSRHRAYQLRDESPEFREQWEMALADAVDTLEEAAWTRARDGVVSEKIAADGTVYTERKYSDTLLIFLLKAHRREMYQDNPKVTINLFNQHFEQEAERLGLDSRAFIDAAYKVMAGEGMTLPERTVGGEEDGLEGSG